MSFVEAIGVVSGFLGIVSFAKDNFGPGDTSGSTYKFAVALDCPGGTSDAGGDLPDVRIWNDAGKFVGMKADPGTIENGNLADFSVDHDNQGVYSLFSANNDAICVAWVTAKWSDDRGGNEYAVSGDYGWACGGSWYASHMYPNSDKKDFQPSCFWIDADGDQPQTGFQVRWPAFSKDVYDDNDKDIDRICNGVDFGFREEEDPNTITYRPTDKKRSEKLRIRQPRRRPAWTDSEIVISDGTAHSAKQLCQSNTSMGPDFAHTGEGLFCDMDTKTLYAFCHGHDTETCFDLDSQTLLAPTHSPTNGTLPGDFKPKAGAVNLAVSKKSKYTNTRDWRSSSSSKKV